LLHHDDRRRRGTARDAELLTQLVVSPMTPPDAKDDDADAKRRGDASDGDTCFFFVKLCDVIDLMLISVLFRLVFRSLAHNLSYLFLVYS
jgi:hypothetical protein